MFRDALDASGIKAMHGCTPDDDHDEGIQTERSSGKDRRI